MSVSGSAQAVNPKLESGGSVPGPDLVAADSAQSSAANEAVVAIDTPSDEPETTNRVRRTVEEICARMADVHELREDMLALGVGFHLVNSLVELSIKQNHDELDKLMQSALAAAGKAHGSQGITAEQLSQKLDALVVLEQDLQHLRKLAGNQGLHMQALNHLTQLIRLNPGDGGVKAINTLVAYADASGISLSRVKEILESHADEPASVLPNISREDLVAPNAKLRRMVADICVGVVLSITMMWLVF